MQMVVGCQDYDFRELEKVRDMERKNSFHNALASPPELEGWHSDISTCP